MKTMLYAGETVQIAQERSAEKAALWVATPQEELHLSMWSGDQSEAPFSAEIPLDAVFASGRDRLAEIALADGEPKRERVRALLPPIGDGYAVLGGQASWSAYTVTPAGEVYLQSTGGETIHLCSFIRRRSTHNWEKYAPAWPFWTENCPFCWGGTLPPGVLWSGCTL